MLRSMPERMVGAALLKVDTFEDVEHDRSATLQAALIVVLSAISGGVGGLLSSQASVVDALLFGILGGVNFLGGVGVGDLGDWDDNPENPGNPSRLGTTGARYRVRPNPGNFEHPGRHSD